MIKVEAKTQEEVLNKLLEENNLEEKDIYYKVTETKKGLIKKSTFIIEAITKTEILEETKTFLKELLTNMGIETNFETKIREKDLYIKMFSDNNSILIGKEAKNLKALEHITKAYLKNKYDIYINVRLDVENYQEKKEKYLIRLAKNIAREVLHTKAEAHLENMNSYQRRIVHNALTDFNHIETISEGEEPNRHVVIKYKK
ncbi:MAG: hypothetical protein IJ574_03350 [Bacilli bacterium]|nr:hypothetical protein [Bacilli bacterium]